MPGSHTFAHHPRWYLVPLRVMLVTFIVTLIAFAVSLLLGIFAVVVAARLRGLEPNMTIAYRDVALPITAIVAGVIFFASTYIEVRTYRRSKTLEEIEQQMRA